MGVDHDGCMTSNITTDFRTIDGLPGEIVEPHELMKDDVVLIVTTNIFTAGVARGEAIAKTMTGCERWYTIDVPSREDERLDLAVDTDRIEGGVFRRIEKSEYPEFDSARALAFHIVRVAESVVEKVIVLSTDAELAMRVRDEGAPDFDADFG